MILHPHPCTTGGTPAVISEKKTSGRAPYDSFRGFYIPTPCYLEPQEPTLYGLINLTAKLAGRCPR